MNEAESRLAEDRRNRSAARGLFDVRLGRVKADLAARPVPARIKRKAQDETLKAIDKGLDIASQSKGVVAATIGALALWVLRKPLISVTKRWLGQGPVQDQPDNGSSEPEQEHAA